MTTEWTIAVEDSADLLGEMLIEVACGQAEHSNEDIAAAALDTGLRVLLGEVPNRHRIESAARAIYRTMHRPPDCEWSELNTTEQSFWLNVGRESVAASDQALIDTIS